MSAGPGSRRILLVDDDAVILRGYGQRLRADGYDVTTVSDGYEALTAAGRGTWDLILLDLRIPYRNGVEVLRVLRSRTETATTPVYVLAQPGDADYVDRAMREGADGVFEKAKIAPRDLVSEVEAIFDGRRRSREAGAAQVPAAASQVPAAVDEIARRFRRETPPSRSAARSMGGAGASMAPGMSQHPGTSMTPGAPQFGGAPASPGASHAPGVQRPSRAAPDIGDQGAADPASPARSMAPPAPAAASLGASAAAAPFDVVLNRMVGQSGPLAHAIGLPPDYTCPICTGQLVLRLEPDVAVEFGVRGHFFCPRCTQ